MSYGNWPDFILDKIFSGSIGDGEEVLCCNKSINTMYAKQAYQMEAFRHLKKGIRVRSDTDRVPSITWLYNAVRLVIVHEKSKDIEGYDKITTSHKIELLKTVRKDKERLVKEIIDEKLSVRQLKARMKPA